MMPRLGEKFDIEIEVISKPRAEYKSGKYIASGLPKAPAIMIDDKVIVEGRDIKEEKLVTAIKQQLE
jgi:glutaredoxin